jgi:hypothetical protein
MARIISPSGKGGSGAPSGVYADIAALGAAYPDGNKNVYVTLDDGNWNYWNGTEWAAGGVYQASVGVVSVTDIVNDTTTGGADKVASAETVKTLDGKITNLATNKDDATEGDVLISNGDGTSTFGAAMKEIKDSTFDTFYGIFDREQQSGNIISCDSPAIKISVETGDETVTINHCNSNLFPSDWTDEIGASKRSFGEYISKTTHSTSYIYGSTAKPINKVLPAGIYSFSFNGDFTSPYIEYVEDGVTKTADRNIVASNNITLLYIKCSSTSIPPGQTKKWTAQLEHGGSITTYAYPQSKEKQIQTQNGYGELRLVPYGGKNIIISDSEIVVEYSANPREKTRAIDAFLKGEIISKSDLINQYGKAINHKLLRGSIGDKFTSETQQGSTGSYVIAIDVTDILAISYPVFKSSSGFGSMFIDENDVIVWFHSETILNTGEQKKVIVPVGAKYFYLNVSVTLSEMEYIFGIMSVKQAIIMGNEENIKKSLSERPDTSLCLCALRTEITDNKIPFTSGFLFHKITGDNGLFYFGHTFDGIKDIGRADFTPSGYMIAVSPSHNCVIATKRGTRGSMYVWKDGVTTELFGDTETKPMGWLYNSGVDFIKDSEGVEHCIFAEYSGSAAPGGFYVWRGTAPYTSENDWETVLFQNYIGDTTVDAITHFHMVRRDPWTNILYLTSGDGHTYCKWWYSTNYGVDWTLFSSGGTSTWEENTLRCINFVFTKDYIYWATDKGTNHSLNRIERDNISGVFDLDTRLKLCDLPEGRATNSICYTDKPKGIFMYDRVDIGFDSFYDKGFDVQWWSINGEELQTLVHVDLLSETWGGHRGKCYVNYASGAEPRPAMGFSVDTPCIMDIPCIAPSNVGTVFYELPSGELRYIVSD